MEHQARSIDEIGKDKNKRQEAGVASTRNLGSWFRQINEGVL